MRSPCEKDFPGIWALNVIVRLLEGWDSRCLEGSRREGRSACPTVESGAKTALGVIEPTDTS